MTSGGSSYRTGIRCRRGRKSFQKRFKSSNRFLQDVTSHGIKQILSLESHSVLLLEQQTMGSAAATQFDYFSSTPFAFF